MAADVHKDKPVLIYLPGLGNYRENSADGVADVLAAALDRRRLPGFNAASQNGVAAPRNLKVAKAIVGDGDEVLVHCFELDYRPRLAPTSGPSGPPAPPGIVRSARFAVVGALAVLWAWRRGAKGRRAKLQLAYGLLLALSMVFAAVAAVVAAVVAAEPTWLPNGFVDWWNGDETAVAGGVGVTVIALWSALRRRLLALATTAERNLRYVHDTSCRQTIVNLVYEAVDGLRHAGWTGDVHLVGYSFGSLVLLDATAPRRDAPAPPLEFAAQLASIVTIGCPLDLVRLLQPSFLGERSRLSGVPWFNVVTPGDVFGSNFRDGDDAPRTPADRPSVIGGEPPITIAYGDDPLTLPAILAGQGFARHGRYWGPADAASCFDNLIDQWNLVPVAPPSATSQPSPASALASAGDAD